MPVLPKSEEVAEIDVVVLAGGLGTRALQLTSGRPKCLLRCGSGFVIDYVIEPLRASDRVRRIVIVTSASHKPYLDEWTNSRSWEGGHIQIVSEPHPLGTTAGVLAGLVHTSTERVMIVNGDTIIAGDLGGLLSHKLSSGVEAALIVSSYPAMSPGAVVELRLDTGRLVHFGTGVSGAEHTSAFTGYGLYKADTIMRLAQLVGSISSFEQDIVKPLVGTNQVIGLGNSGPWIDTGTPQGLWVANMFALRGIFHEPRSHRLIQNQLFISADAEIGKDVHLELVVVGENCRIDDSAIVEASVVLDGSSVRRGVKLSNVIVTPGEVIACEPSVWRI